MAIKRDTGIYECSYCGKIYKDPMKADACRDSHNLVYIQLSVEDLDSIVKFFYFKKDELLNPVLVSRLKRILREQIIKNEKK